MRGCGADLEFGIGVQALKCPHCGFEKSITVDGEVTERDFMAGLQKLREMRCHEVDASAGAEVECAGCGSKLFFDDGEISSACGYCGAPLQNAKAVEGGNRLPVDGVLPFSVDREAARGNLREWVGSRWFAPSEFKERGVQGRFEGLYCPFLTFYAMTSTHYRGERGEDYTVRVGSGDNERSEHVPVGTMLAGTFSASSMTSSFQVLRMNSWNSCENLSLGHSSNSHF